MRSHLFDEKFLKNKPDFLLKFKETNLQINFLIGDEYICNFNFINASEKFYKEKTLLIFETNYDYVVENLKQFAKKYFYSTQKYYVIFNRNIDYKPVYFTKKIELNSENFDITFSEDKVMFYLLISKSDF